MSGHWRVFRISSQAGGFSTYKEAEEWVKRTQGMYVITPCWDNLSPESQVQVRKILVEDGKSYEQITQEDLDRALAEWGHRQGSITPGDD